MYARDLGGRQLTFGVSGRLWKDALVMYDHQTQSLWGHVIGEAIHGELLGSRLETYPAVQTTWKAWKKSHPGTKVLKKPLIWESTYRRYDANPRRMGIHGRQIAKSQLPPKSKIVGFEVDGRMFAFALSSLSPGKTFVPLVDEATLVMHVDETGQGITLWRVQGRGALSNLKLSAADPTILVDSSGAKFSLFDESPTLADGALVRVQVVIAYWFGWHNFHPQTEVHTP